MSNDNDDKAIIRVIDWLEKRNNKKEAASIQHVIAEVAALRAQLEEARAVVDALMEWTQTPIEQEDGMGSFSYFAEIIVPAAAAWLAGQEEVGA